MTQSSEGLRLNSSIHNQPTTNIDALHPLISSIPVNWSKTCHPWYEHTELVVQILIQSASSIQLLSLTKINFLYPRAKINQFELIERDELLFWMNEWINKNKSSDIYEAQNSVYI